MPKSFVNITNLLTFICVLLQCFVVLNANVHLRESRSPDQKSSIHTSNVNVSGPPKTITETGSSSSSNTNVTTEHLNRAKDPPGPDSKLNVGALLRGFYVFVGLGAIVVLYIIVRTIRLRRKKTTVRKYGILASREDVEMTPLGAEDDEEDTVLFDANNH